MTSQMEKWEDPNEEEEPEEYSDSDDEDEGPCTGAKPAWWIGGSLILLGVIVVCVSLATNNDKDGISTLGVKVLDFGGASRPETLTFTCLTNTTNHTEFIRCTEERRNKLKEKIHDLPPEVRENFEAFGQFLLENSRSYFDGEAVNVEEFKERLQIFGQTLKLINKRNTEAEQSNVSIRDRVRHGITKYADWTQEEFQALLGGRPSTDDSPERRLRWPRVPVEGQATITEAPCDKNWASRSTIRNQGSCGNCWAFSAVESLRAAVIQQTGKDPGLLSTQYLTNCMYEDNTCKGGTGGCCGGNPATAFRFISQNGGIPTQDEYGNVFKSLQDAEAGGGSSGSGFMASGGPVSPTGNGITFSGNFPTRDFRCKTGIPNAVNLNGMVKSLKTEKDMSDYVCNTGSLSVLVDASQWQTYAGGVMNARVCGTSINHAVVVIGVSKENNAWIVQNSWGPNWGVGVDGTPVPRDKYSNCNELARSRFGCNQKLTSGERVSEACKASCGNSNSGTEGGYIMVEFGTDACGITHQADVVPDVVAV